jgi:hypothetical protein
VSMKISDKTKNILENFSSINSSIVVKKGNTIQTVSPQKNIMAVYECEETFESDFAFYDLLEFLRGLTILKNPDFDFSNEKYVSITSGNSKVKYYYCDPSLITTSDKQMPDLQKDVEFTLSEEVLNSLLKASKVYQLNDMSLVGNGEEMMLVVSDRDDVTSHSFSVVVGKTTRKFTVNFKVENLRIVPDTYNVKITFPHISTFTSTSHKLTYLIALEPNSDIED